MKEGNYQQLAEKLNNMIKMAKKINVANKDDFFNSYGFIEPNGFKVDSKDKYAFNQIMIESYSSLSFFNSKVSFDYFKKDIIEIIKYKFHSSSKLENDEVSELVKKYEELPVKNFTVYREIYGLELDQDSPKLGLFTIRNLAILTTLPEQNKLPLLPATSCVIEVTVEAAEPDKARKDANTLFEQFDFVMRYIIGNEKNLDVGITDFSSNRTFRSFVFCEGIPRTVAYEGKGAIQDMTFSTIKKVIDESFMGLFEFIGNKHLSDIGKRILLAVKWISEAFKDSSNDSAFLKSVVALEILCANNLASSISSSIAEISALMIGNDYDSRLEIKRDIKDLYDKRSGIVHSGKKKINTKDLKRIWSILDTIIKKYLLFEQRKNFETVEDIFTEIEKLKYNNIHFS